VACSEARVCACRPAGGLRVISHDLRVVEPDVSDKPGEIIPSSGRISHWSLWSPPALPRPFQQQKWPISHRIQPKFFIGSLKTPRLGVEVAQRVKDRMFEWRWKQWNKHLSAQREVFEVFEERPICRNEDGDIAKVSPEPVADVDVRNRFEDLLRLHLAAKPFTVPGAHFGYSTLKGGNSIRISGKPHLSIKNGRPDRLDVLQVVKDLLIKAQLIGDFLYPTAQALG
jgi:hypothetical protein